MIAGSIQYYDGTSFAVAIGTSEDVKAPRGLADLEKAGNVVDDNVRAAYKAFLAGIRQGNIPKDTKFLEWSEGVADIDLKLSERQIDEAVALGQFTPDAGERLKELMKENQGEAAAPHGE